MLISRELTLVTDFLSAIGLAWRWQGLLDGEGIAIVDGELRITPGALTSSVLRAAGHLATLPGELRPFAQRNTPASEAKPVSRHLIASDCGGPEATAWAWAVGKYLGLSAETIIHPDEYADAGPFVRLKLETRSYAGINALSDAGFCAIRPSTYAAAGNLPAYPALKFWLHREFGKASYLKLEGQA